MSVSGFPTEVASAESGSPHLIKPERPFVIVHILVANWAVLISQMEDERDDNSDSEADGQKYPIGRECDQHRYHDYCSNDQAGGAFYTDGHPREHD